MTKTYIIGFRVVRISSGESKGVAGSQCMSFNRNVFTLFKGSVFINFGKGFRWSNIKKLK